MQLMPSDGCTFFPDGNYVSCCEAHDAAYGAGYNKWKADMDLRNCAMRCHKPILAWIMWIGVTLFGGYSYWKAQQK